MFKSTTVRSIRRMPARSKHRTCSRRHYCSRNRFVHSSGRSAVCNCMPTIYWSSYFNHTRISAMQQTNRKLLKIWTQTPTKESFFVLRTRANVIWPSSGRDIRKDARTVLHLDQVLLTCEFFDRKELATSYSSCQACNAQMWYFVVMVTCMPSLLAIASNLVVGQGWSWDLYGFWHYETLQNLPIAAAARRSCLHKYREIHTSRAFSAADPTTAWNNASIDIQPVWSASEI